MFLILRMRLRDIPQVNKNCYSGSSWDKCWKIMIFTCNKKYCESWKVNGWRDFFFYNGNKNAKICVSLEIMRYIA